MVHTVGLLGISGNVGAPAAKLLAEAANAGKIKLVLFHRASKAPDASLLSKAVEAREIDPSEVSPALEAAVKDINVFISAVGFEGLSIQPNIVQALSKSSEIAVFVPAEYSTVWTDADMANPELGGMMSFVRAASGLADSLGIATSKIYTGVFLQVFLDGFLHGNAKTNELLANKQQLANPLPVTSMDHLAEAITEIATADPETIKGKQFSAVTFQPTGQEVVDIFTKVNGKATTIKDYSPEKRDELLATPPMGSVQVAYLDKWAGDEWLYHTKTQLKVKNSKTLEEYTKEFIAS